MAIIKMKISDNGHKKLQAMMKKMKFKDESLFLRYCVLNTIKTKVTEKQKKQVQKEMKLIKSS
jgi:hypothetical protein